MHNQQQQAAARKKIAQEFVAWVSAKKISAQLDSQPFDPSETTARLFSDFGCPKGLNSEQIQRFMGPCLREVTIALYEHKLKEIAEAVQATQAAGASDSIGDAAASTTNYQSLKTYLEKSSSSHAAEADIRNLTEFLGYETTVQTGVHPVITVSNPTTRSNASFEITHSGEGASAHFACGNTVGDGNCAFNAVVNGMVSNTPSLASTIDEAHSMLSMIKKDMHALYTSMLKDANIIESGNEQTDFNLLIAKQEEALLQHNNTQLVSQSSSTRTFQHAQSSNDHVAAAPHL